VAPVGHQRAGPIFVVLERFSRLVGLRVQVADPVQFLWRRRLWRVLDVETRWRETADWWSRPTDDLLAEAEVWRVVAAAGRASEPGVYELARSVAEGSWVLRAVVD